MWVANSPALESADCPAACDMETFIPYTSSAHLAIANVDLVMTDHSNIEGTNPLNSTLEELRGQGEDGRKDVEDSEALESGLRAMERRLRMALDLRERIHEEVQLSLRPVILK